MRTGRPRRDLTGQVFGLLQVISFAKSNKRGSFFLCRCECGRTKTIPGSALVRGGHKSCGYHCPLRVGRIGHLPHTHTQLDKNVPLDKHAVHVPTPPREPWTFEGNEAALAAQYGGDSK